MLHPAGHAVLSGDGRLLCWLSFRLWALSLLAFLPAEPCYPALTLSASILGINLVILPNIAPAAAAFTALLRLAVAAPSQCLWQKPHASQSQASDASVASYPASLESTVILPSPASAPAAPAVAAAAFAALGGGRPFPASLAGASQELASSAILRLLISALGADRHLHSSAPASAALAVAAATGAGRLSPVSAAGASILSPIAAS